MSELAVRLTIYDLVEIRRRTLEALERMQKADKDVDDILKALDSQNFYRVEKRGYHQSDTKEVDQRIWRYMLRLYNLEKYMLCTEYKKVEDQIENYDFPEFTIENAEGWLLSLKVLIYESVRQLVEDVFNRITKETYRTGGSWNSSQKKKRNNNGIDKFFILTTHDDSSLKWWSGKPTITDDLEKACYILDGKDLPEVTIKATMHRGKIWESENDYFWIRICQNGNTHYKLKDGIRDKLNLYGSRKGVIGENIRIKVFDKNDKW